MKAAILEPPTADEYLQKFSTVINGQDDYWIAQNNHQGLPKGIQALKKALNTKNCSFNSTSRHKFNPDIIKVVSQRKKYFSQTFTI